jgi:hypothetical protein
MSATVTSVTYTTQPMDDTHMAVVFTVTTSVGDIVQDGPRILAKTVNLTNASTQVGNYILQVLTQQEIATWLGSYQAGGILKYAAKTDIVTALREAYRNYTDWELCKLSNVLVQYYQAGAFTAAQFQAAFGITAAQWTTLVGIVQGYNTTYNNVMAALGQ